MRRSACVYDGEAAFLAALARGDLHARLGRPRPAALPGVTAAADDVVPPEIIPREGAVPAPPASYSGPPAERLVVIIRYEGPKGGPGMPEMLTPTSAVVGQFRPSSCSPNVATLLHFRLLLQGLASGTSSRCSLTGVFLAARMASSSATSSPRLLRVAPSLLSSTVGGGRWRHVGRSRRLRRIPSSRAGDTITVDAERRVMEVEGLSEAEWSSRRSAWERRPRHPRPASGYLRKFAQLTSNASRGCVTDAAPF